MYKCNNCGTEYEGNFCPVCGQRRQSGFCPQCGSKTDGSAKFCMQCGAPLDTADTKTPTVQNALSATPYWFNSKKKLCSALKYLPIILMLLYAVLTAISLLLPAAIYPMYGLAADESLGNMLSIKKSDIGTDISDLADGVLQIWLFSIVICVVCVIVFFTRNKRNNGQAAVKSALAAYFVSALGMALVFAISCAFLAKISDIDEELGGFSSFHVLKVGAGAYCLTVFSIVLCAFTIISGAVCAVIYRKRPEFIDYKKPQPYASAYVNAYSAADLYGGRYEDYAARPAPVTNPRLSAFSKIAAADALKKSLIPPIIVVVLASLVTSIGFAAGSSSVEVSFESGLKSSSLIPFAVIVIAVSVLLGLIIYLTRFSLALRINGNAQKSNHINKKFSTAQLTYLQIVLIVLFAALLALFVLALNKAADYSADASLYTLNGQDDAAEEAHKICLQFQAMAVYYVIMYAFIGVLAAASLFIRHKIKLMGREFFGVKDYSKAEAGKTFEAYADEYKTQRAQYLQFVEKNKIYDINCRAYTDKSRGR